MHTKTRSSRGARGFTIVEATIVIGIIAVLAGIVLYAVGIVRKKGDVAAETGMVTALQKAVEQFKQTYGFLPPLVIDSPTGANPISGTDQVQVWSTQELGNSSTTVNGSVTNNATTGDRRCYSVHSLPYYLAGALDVTYDGGAGLTFTMPLANGQFSKKGRAIEAMVDLTQQKTRLGATRLYVSNPTNANAALRVDCRIRDRWSDTNPSVIPAPAGPNGDMDAKEIRYYRWYPAYFPKGDPKAGQVQYWNIPVAIGGNMDNTLPPTNAELRTAEYAIVSAGPDHIFGTPDDIMEVGR